MDELRMDDFLGSDEFFRQFKKEWKKYNSDINNAIELVQIIDQDEKLRLAKEEETNAALGSFGALI